MKYFALLIFIITMLSCGNNHSKKKYVLMFESDQSVVEENRLIFDSLLMSCFKDSIVFLKCSNDKCFESLFVKNENGFFEVRDRYSDIGEYLGTDTILTFSKKDTTFTYKSAYEFVPIVLSLSYADCVYKIRRTENNYITIKQSLIDTTYREIFFYDKEYNIYKFINTWKDNQCVYVKEK